MNRKRSWKKLIIPVALVLLVIALIGYLFQDELTVLGYQVGTETGIVSTDTNGAYSQAITQGYVEYLQDTSQDQQALKYPSLSSVKARLVIARVNIDGPIVDGVDDSAMNRGFWHFPSSSPFAGKGNTVIIGHRYLNLPPRKDTFFNLDRVRVGDNVKIVTTRGTIYYTVQRVWVVSSTEMSILQQTDQEQLTLVTCHPLWTSQERLVIIAVPTYTTEHGVQ